MIDVICPRCGEEGRPRGKDRSRYCIQCRRESSKGYEAKIKKERPFYVYAKHKNNYNKKQGYSYKVTEDYLKGIWTGFCSITGVKISIDGDRKDPHRANLDRINPNEGYKEGNVVWLSARANRLKSNVTVKELESILKWMKEK